MKEDLQLTLARLVIKFGMNFILPIGVCAMFYTYALGILLGLHWIFKFRLELGANVFWLMLALWMVLILYAVLCEIVRSLVRQPALMAA